ncbi:MAG: EAL domain-containing protein [Epsilonproteobacteria bacterium]|nr:EAL domain-containing protein [Campylobacterota bacterium]
MSIMYEIFQRSPDAILISDRHRRVIDVNPAFERLTGYTKEECLGKRPEEFLKSNLMPSEFYENFWRSIKEKGFWAGSIIDRRKNGTSFSAWQTVFCLKNRRTGKINHYISIIQTLPENRKWDDAIEKLLFFDGLTELPNRTYFSKLISDRIQDADKEEERLALIYFDVDDTQTLNDALGYPAGDQLLRTIAQRLRDATGEKEIVARISGDEFAVLTQDFRDSKTLYNRCCQILEQISQPLIINHTHRKVSISGGISLFPQDGKTPETLMASADLAMHKAKKSARGRCILYQKRMQEEVMERIELLEEFKRAIATGELILHYQPKVDMHTNKIRAFEALIRWEHPHKGLLGPAAFMPLIEESDLIVPMTELIFTEIDAMLKRFDRIGLPDVSIALNISAYHFQTETLIEELTDQVKEHYLRQGRVEIEMTETAIVKNMEQTRRQLEALHDLGVTVAIDDFGTGHASLTYLKVLPIDKIKIDKIFIDGVPDQPKDMAIVESTILLARKLGIATVAEGVEHRRQADYLIRHGIDYIQGYLYAPPLPEIEALELAKRYPYSP